LPLLAEDNVRAIGTFRIYLLGFSLHLVYWVGDQLTNPQPVDQESCSYRASRLSSSRQNWSLLIGGSVDARDVIARRQRFGSDIFLDGHRLLVLATGLMVVLRLGEPSHVAV